MVHPISLAPTRPRALILAVLPLGLVMATACGAQDSNTPADGATVDGGTSDAGEECTSTLELSYQLTDTNQDLCYNNRGEQIVCPSSGELFFGQDATHVGLSPSYSVTCDGSVVLDNRTGLMWQRAHHATRVSYAEAEAACAGLTLGGESDWRMPSIKELLSISDWRGSQHVDGAFYIDAQAFDFDYPDLSGGELTGSHMNQMMGQTWSATSRPDVENLRGDTKYFFNFLDAHIKSNSATNASATMFYRCVRGDEHALNNDLVDNGDETVTDRATQLMWQKANGELSSGDYQGPWSAALRYCEDLELAGHDDWRLPDVKALQSIVSYDPPDWSGTRMALDTTVFEFNLPAGKDLMTRPTTSPPDGRSVAPFFWSSTTHGDNTTFAAYVCFGPCWAVEDLGFGGDIHGPGAQRSDPKDDQGGNVWDRVGSSIGDQKDTVQVDNFIRCVRDAP